MTDAIQLNLWEWLEEAAQAVEQVPELVSVADGITALETVMNAIIDDPPASQLSVAAEAFAQLSAVLARKSEEWLTHWERADLAGIALPDDWTVGLVRQSVSFDLSVLIEPPTAPLKPKRVRPTSDSSIAAPVAAERLLTLLEQLHIPPEAVQQQLADLAGAELPSHWQDIITQCLQQCQHQPITFAQLQNASGLARVELWLGLLLGGYTLKPVHHHANVEPEKFYLQSHALLIEAPP